MQLRTTPTAYTMLGEPLGSAYDVVLAHEHLSIDIRCWLDTSHEPSRHLRHARVDPRTLAEIRQNPFSCLDNLLLGPASLIAGELRALRPFGRVLIIDVTPENVGRDPEVLAELARCSGIDIVMGCGRYIASSRPGDDPGMPAEDYRDEIVAQFSAGLPRPAVIGEIGTGDPIEPVEIAALRGAAQAQALIGAPLYVHLHPWGRRGHEALDIVEAEGADLDKVVLCHLDAQIPEGLDYHRSLLRRGAVVAFDIWGDEFQYGHVRMPTDAERLEATLRLIEEGFGGQLVHSQDVCTKTQLRRYGGAGYDHIPRVVGPMLLNAGLTRQAVHEQLAGNALRLLSHERGRR